MVVSKGESSSAAPCAKCGGDRNHNSLHSVESSWSEDHSIYGYNVHGTDRYELLRCVGCDTITMRHTGRCSEDVDARVSYYPPVPLRKEPDWMPDLESWDAYDLLREVYAALRTGAPRLAILGVRALLEHVMVDQVEDQGSFTKNVDAFHDSGYVSSPQREVLERVLEAGHAGMHRSYRASPEDLARCMDVAEHVLESVYINPLRAEQLKQSVPDRPPPKPRGPR